MNTSLVRSRFPFFCEASQLLFQILLPTACSSLTFFAHIKLQHASQFSFSTRVHMSFVQSPSSVGLKHLAKLSFPQWSPRTSRSHRWSHCSQIVCISWDSRSTWSCVDLHRTFVTGTGRSSWNLNWIRCHHWLLFFLLVLNDHQVCSAQHRAQTPLGAHRFMVVSAVCIDQRCLQIVSGISALEVVNRLHGQPYVAACSCARDLVMYRFSNSSWYVSDEATWIPWYSNKHGKSLRVFPLLLCCHPFERSCCLVAFRGSHDFIREVQ